jgi:hypothetical protein
VRQHHPQHVVRGEALDFLRLAAVNVLRLVGTTQPRSVKMRIAAGDRRSLNINLLLATVFMYPSSA